MLEEERRAEDVYTAALAIRRLLELHVSGRKTVSLDDVMSRFGITVDEGDETGDDDQEMGG